MTSLFLTAWVLGALLGLVASPLGCLVVWRKMSFFTDAMAHGSLLGFAIAALLSLPAWLGALLLVLTVGFLVVNLQDNRLPKDAIFAWVASSLLCLSVVASQFIPSLNSQLKNLLLGDILSLSLAQLPLIALFVMLSLLLIFSTWQQQIMAAVSAEQAKIRGIHVKKMEYITILILAFYTVIALQAIGSLLMGAILVIPAISARLFAKSPNGMLGISFAITQVCILLGITLSFLVNIPTGPSIVLCMSLCFLLGFAVKHWFSKRQNKTATPTI